MSHHQENNKQIPFSGLKIIPLPIPNFQKKIQMDNPSSKIQKYLSSSPRPNPFSNSDSCSKNNTQNDYDLEIEDDDFIQLKPNCFNNHKILSNLLSKNKIEDEKSTTLGEITSHHNNFKKVTFSTVEVIRVENYKKYNKIKKKVNHNLDKSIWAMEDNPCYVF